ncbi:MAG: hypothetical protein HRU09_04560 [Oligoflexales bacterium]|nr:hypothetical protein [Oligoflexales bacterium]
MLTRLLHKLVTLLSVAIFLLISSCAYRFTNLHMRAPNKAKTIAVEGIYDTSRLALPHEYLWESLQKYIAINGRLKLAPKNQADLYLRCQLVSAEIRPFDVVFNEIKDPSSLIDESAEVPNPYPMGAYPSYRRASSYARQEQVSATANVEVWDLRTKQLVFRGTYGGYATYGISSHSVEYGFLKADEALENGFAKAADTIASRAVADLLRR